MNKKIKRKKTIQMQKHIEPLENIEKLKDEDEFISFHYDPEGKVIFLNKTITPVWLIDKLSNHFISDRNEGVKCWRVSL